MGIARVFPERLHVSVKEMDGIAKRQGRDVKVIEHIPESTDV
jgi:hypothetical protein